MAGSWVQAVTSITKARIVELLEPYAEQSEDISRRLPELAPKFSAYLDLLVRWNARTNLTSIRDPDEIVRRHFGESIYTATILEAGVAPASTLLDFGSGAGLPGLPIQICFPELDICLAESQGKKAAFLRETIRELDLPTEVWARRVEDMPPLRMFSVAALRAVDRMTDALQSASTRVEAGGALVALGNDDVAIPPGWCITKSHAIPESDRRFVHIFHRAS